MQQKKKTSAKRKAKKRTDELKDESIKSSPRGSPTNGSRSRSPMINSPLLDTVDRDSTGGGRLTPHDSAPSSPVRKRPKSRSNTPNLSNLSNLSKLEYSESNSTPSSTPPEITSSHPHQPPSIARVEDEARVPSTANPSSNSKQNSNEVSSPQPVLFSPFPVNHAAVLRPATFYPFCEYIR